MAGKSAGGLGGTSLAELISFPLLLAEKNLPKVPHCTGILLLFSASSSLIHVRRFQDNSEMASMWGDDEQACELGVERLMVLSLPFLFCLLGSK